MDSFPVCPKCGHRPPQPLGATDACPACGVFMHKLHPPPPQAEERPVAPVPKLTADATAEELRAASHGADRIGIQARAALLVALAVWGLRLAMMDISDGEIGSSFMHGILLTIHEAGHIIFIPFGEFLTIAGGSLFQLLLPAGIGVAFLLKNRDPYGAAVCFWWAGVSLMDLAPYIYDAVHPQLMLLTGTTGEDGPHDWIYLFGRLGGLKHSQGWGRFVHLLGIFASFGSLAWGGWGLWRRSA